MESRIICNRRKIAKSFYFHGLVSLGILYIIFLIFNQFSNTMLRCNRYAEYDVQKNFSILGRNIHLQPLNDSTNREINEVLQLKREEIQKEMYNYDYPKGKYGINISSLDGLLVEKGGRPMRSVLITTWRSGSTFFGALMKSHPATFYHFEPLAPFGIMQRRELKSSNEELKFVSELLQCDYSDSQKYVDYAKNGRPWLISHNSQLWWQCQRHMNICWDPRFLSKFCRLFPFQLAKVLRLRLTVARTFLEEGNSLGVRMVFMIRDPRAVFHSRKILDWCIDSPDCIDPSLICRDMESDFAVAVELTKKYPKTFRVIRYEDLSMDPFTYSKSLFEFYGLNFHPKVQEYLETHTKMHDKTDMYSTYRNSSVVPFHWREELNFEVVEKIQSVCGQALKLWGYVQAANATHQKNFNPITDYHLDL